MIERPWWMPGERGWVTIGLYALAAAMLGMAMLNPKLWEVKLFELLIQAIFITGLINAVLAFHFSANKGGERRDEITKQALDVAHAATSSGNEEEPRA